MPDGSNMAQSRALGAYPEEQPQVTALTISRPLQLHLKIQCFRPLWTQVTQLRSSWHNRILLLFLPITFSTKKNCHATPFHKLSFNHLLPNRPCSVPSTLVCSWKEHPPWECSLPQGCCISNTQNMDRHKKLPRTPEFWCKQQQVILFCSVQRNSWSYTPVWTRITTGNKFNLLNLIKTTLGYYI